MEATESSYTTIIASSHWLSQQQSIPTIPATIPPATWPTIVYQKLAEPAAINTHNSCHYFCCHLAFHSLSEATVSAVQTLLIFWSVWEDQSLIAAVGSKLHELKMAHNQRNRWGLITQLQELAWKMRYAVLVLWRSLASNTPHGWSGTPIFSCQPGYSGSRWCPWFQHSRPCRHKRSQQLGLYMQRNTQRSKSLEPSPY